MKQLKGKFNFVLCEFFLLGSEGKAPFVSECCWKEFWNKFYTKTVKFAEIQSN